MDARPVALVTGSARRLGRSIVLHLAANGWDVAVHYHSSHDEAAEVAAEARRLGAAAAHIAADLAEEDACRALVPAVVQRLGRVDLVVNNASIFEYDGARDATVAAMDRHWRANVAPAVLLAQALHAHLAARQAEGCVVNLLDQKLRNMNPDYFSYTLSKAALESATTMLAMAMAPVLRVCAVAPGLVLGSSLIDAQRLAQLHAASPLGRGAGERDVAEAVRYLATAQGVTGVTLLVDAGQHLQASNRDFAFQGKPLA